MLSSREHYKNFSKTVIFTCKSWIFDNKKTSYELKRVQTLLKMIIDHSLALILLEKPKIRYLKIDLLKKESGKMLNFSTDYVKSDHHKAVNEAS